MVIAVIAVLIGILLPALGKARDAGRAVKCLANQRQLGTALMGYASLYNEWIPRESGNSETIPRMGETRPPNSSGRIPEFPAWFRAWSPVTQRADVNIAWAFNLRPMLSDTATANNNNGDVGDRYRSMEIYRDPGRPKDDHTIHYVNNGIRFRMTTAGTTYVDEVECKPPVRLSQLFRSDSVLYLTCFADDPGNRRSANYNATAATDLDLAIFYDIRRLTNINGQELTGDPTSWRRTAPKRHGGRGANALYMDGHASFIEGSKLLDVNTWDDGHYR